MDSIDLDCDGSKETVFELYYGNPTLDFCHAFNLLIRDTSIQICSDTICCPTHKIPFYNAGDTLCSGLHQWRTDTFYRLGWGAGLCFPYTDLVTDKYFAYRRSTDHATGWVKVSFDMHPGIDTVIARIDEVLVLCDYTEVAAISPEDFFTVHPNPSFDGKIIVECKSNLVTLEVIDLYGRILNVFKENQSDIMLPDETGIYFVRAIDATGRIGVRKVCRH